MTGSLILTGDVNLMNVTDPTVPFRHVAAELHSADIVFANLECCLHLPSQQSHANEGFFADPQVGGEALRLSGIHAVGIANNVNYGSANIAASIARLDQLGVLHTGAGPNLAAARAPAIIARNGLRVGVVQRSSVYWPTDHEAQVDSPGIAVIHGHTAYHVPVGRIAPGVPPSNRPGMPPLIVTWADAAYLEEFRKDIEALRQQVDIVVASCHWGLGKDVLQYMREIAHTAIDAGADVVAGHGPHYSLAVEAYRGRPIFYGLGSFSFDIGHAGRKQGDWVGMIARITATQEDVTSASFQFARHNDDNETILNQTDQETATLTDITVRSHAFGTRLLPGLNEVFIQLGC